MNRDRGDIGRAIFFNGHRSSHPAAI